MSKKLSGAQRRKLAIAEAAAAGLVVPRRKPMKNDLPADPNSLLELKMAIVSATHPKQKLTPHQGQIIKEMVLQLIQKAQKGHAPRFKGVSFVKGMLYLQCLDAASKTWLMKNVANIKPWEGAELKVAKVGDLTPKVHAVVRLPVAYTEREPEIILKMFARQNDGFDASEWTMVRKPRAGTRDYVFELPRTSLMELHRLDFKLYLGMNRVVFREAKVGSWGFKTKRKSYNFNV